MALARPNRRIIRPSNPLAPPGRAFGFDAAHVAALGIDGSKGVSFVALNGGMVSALTGAPATKSGSPVAKVLSGLGSSILFGTTTDGFTTPYSTASLSDATAAAIVQFTSVGGAAYNGIFGDTNSGLLVLDVTTHQFSFYFNGLPHPSGILPVAGVPYFVIVSSRGSSVLDYVVRNLLTGVVQTATVNPTNSPLASAGTLNIGNNNLTTQGMNGHLAAAMKVSRSISKAAMVQWADDPWGFWYPR